MVTRASAVPERPVAGPLSGAQMFARYAYPPNSLGYCGPTDSGALLEYSTSGVVDAGLADLARSFTGAWPYLELIASATGIGEPLDRRVVETYWVGSELLTAVDLRTTARSMEERFRPRIGSRFPFLIEGVLAGGSPHHGFHVFGVYPWVGMLSEDRKTADALRVLDRCRIRWGRVVQVRGAQVVVSSRPLVWDGRELTLGPATDEVATRAVGGPGRLGELEPGDWVSLHWDWICDRLTRRQLSTLRRCTLSQLEITNSRVEHSGPRLLLT